MGDFRAQLAGPTSPEILWSIVMRVWMACGWKSMSCVLALLGGLGVSPASTLIAEEHWPAFRGNGDSQSTLSGLPVQWSLRGRSPGNWERRLPGYGQSSPVVWGDRIFVTAVSGEKKEHLHLLAVNLADGQILWQRDFAASQQIPDRDSVSRGAPTPVATADRVFVVFESGDVAALTHAGEVLWQRSFVNDYGELQGPHGYASSPVLVDNLLILQVAHAGPSYILALDTHTGENRWKVDHPSQTGWSSPVAYDCGSQKGVIVSTAGLVRGLDPLTGEELWRVSAIQGNSTATPTVFQDLVVIGTSEPRGGESGEGGRPPRRAPATSENAPDSEAVPQSPPGCVAIRLGGTGDISETHVVWRADKVASGYASPVVAADCVYFVNRVGGLQCVNLKSGQLLWQQRLPGQVWASPVAHAGQVTFFGKDGAVISIPAGKENPVWAESSLSATDVVYGVAAVQNSWIIRTGRTLLRISAGESLPTSAPAGE